jgi:hypothetical protein
LELGSNIDPGSRILLQPGFLNQWSKLNRLHQQLQFCLAISGYSPESQAVFEVKNNGKNNFHRVLSKNYSPIVYKCNNNLSLSSGSAHQQFAWNPRFSPH